MIDLPPRARVFVGVVITVGLAVFLMCLPYARVDQPLVFAGLLVISALSASLTESLPRATTESRMSVAFAVDFAALVLLGPHQAMVVAMGGVLSQLGLETADRMPIHRSLFNAASLVITVQVAGLTMGLAGGAAPSMPMNELARGWSAPRASTSCSIPDSRRRRSRCRKTHRS
jgi:hypothetical protein